MIVHIVPSGLSILKNLRAGDRHRTASLEGWAITERIHRTSANDWSAECGERFNQAVDILFPDANPWNPVDLSAECASLARVPRNNNGRPNAELPDPDDRVVFLASDTAHGVLAALLNAAFLGRVVHFHDRPARGTDDVGQAVREGGGMPVHVIRIPGLEPLRTDMFVNAMIEVGNALTWVRQWPGDATIIHASGGYKAAIPYLMVFGEYMKNLRPGVRMYCLHEDDGPGTRPDPIEIFLRRPDPYLDRDEIDFVVRGHEHPNLSLRGQRHLEGFAYERLGNGYQLTDLGQVLSSFFCDLTQ